MFDFIFVFFFNDRNNIEPDFEREIVFLYICVCRVYDMSYLSDPYMRQYPVRVFRFSN